MLASKYYIKTQKQAPNEAELISHKLMLRAGLIKRLTSGIYTWMPLGLRVLRKIERIVREEMHAINAIEILMPAVQPAEIWKESERWDIMGSEMLRIKDRHNHDFCFGPTHEEVITDIIRRDVKSYKELPLSMYQIQTKFRDEVRPRFGVMRAREFIMKDAYSFHTDFESLNATYNDMYKAYSNIFNRLGLKFRPVAADTGAIGGTGSHEFQVLAECGEDIIVYSDNSDYAANIELAEAKASRDKRGTAQFEMTKVSTPTQKTCKEVAQLLAIQLNNTVKSIVVEGIDNNPVLLLIRGDHELNEVKVSKIKQIKQPMSLVDENVIKKHFNCQPGFIGPVGFNGLIIADIEVNLMNDFVCGANDDFYHLINVNFGRDCKEADLVVDMRNVVAGDLSPDGHGTLQMCKGIEVGHIFQLRTKYSQKLNAVYLDQNGKNQVMEMGCYGIGVSRIVGAAIEQNHDKKGIIFPINMAPFELIITPFNYTKDNMTKQAADNLYQNAKKIGLDVLLDDRHERIGSLLADSELLGIPYRIVVSEKTLANNQVELYTRQTETAELIDLEEIINYVDTLIRSKKT